MRKIEVVLGTTNLIEPHVRMKYKSEDDLVLVYNLKDEKKYSVAIKDLSLDYDLVYYDEKWRYIMRKYRPRGKGE